MFVNSAADVDGWGNPGTPFFLVQEVLARPPSRRDMEEVMFFSCRVNLVVGYTGIYLLS